MHYRESKDKSAEILRMAIEHMSHQESGYHPMAFALWYEHVAGVNPALSGILERRLQTKQPLTDADVLELHAKYILSRDIEVVQSIQRRLLHLLETTSRGVSETSSDAVQFGGSLDGHSARLRALTSSDVLQGIVAELLVETQQMASSSTTLSRHLEASAQEIQSLTQQLQVAQAEAAEATRDYLTRLPNRRGLAKAVQELIDRSGSLEGSAMLVVDVDHFKDINDMYGHLGGDTILRAVSQVLIARTKGSDVPSRLGGDEFAVLLPGTPLAGALALAEQIRTTVLHGKVRRIDQAGEIEFTLSLGVAQGERGDTFEALVHKADRALYQAKGKGRNRVSS